MIIRLNHINIDLRCRGFCKLPYPGHKKGCPNYDKHEECPPKVKTVDQIFNLDNELYFAVQTFDLKSHINYMHQKHPDWSDAQLRNLLYWQGGVRKKLIEKTKEFIEDRSNGAMIYTLFPEAMGVMVIDTTQEHGIPIEKKPTDTIYKIALVGYPKRTTSRSMFDF